MSNTKTIIPLDWTTKQPLITSVLTPHPYISLHSSAMVEEAYSQLSLILASILQLLTSQDIYIGKQQHHENPVGNA